MNALRLARALLAAALLCGTAGAIAQQPLVRAHLASAEPPWVGEGVTLVVELLAPGYFTTTAFDLPEPAGVLLMPPSGHPLVGGETIAGTYYTVQRHELRAWPMRAGEQSIPAFDVRISFKRNPLDTQSESAVLTTAPLPLQAKAPPGSAGLGTVISARGLELSERWEPPPGGEPVMAGAAFTRTVSFSAPDVPGMLFPPFPAGAIDGLGVYSKRALQDSEDRGALQGRRSDTITYVMKRPGQYVVPAVKFIWFDLDTKQLRTKELPAQTFDVIVNPALASAAETASEGGRDAGYAVAAGLIVGLLLLVVLAWRARRTLARLLAPLGPVHLQALNPTDQPP